MTRSTAGSVLVMMTSAQRPSLLERFRVHWAWTRASRRDLTTNKVRRGLAQTVVLAYTKHIKVHILAGPVRTNRHYNSTEVIPHEHFQHISICVVYS